MKKLLPATLLSLGLITAAHADDWCQHKADRSSSVDATGARKIIIGAGAGDLKVGGSPGQTAVQAKGQACASSEELLGQIQLESRREGDTVYLKTVLPDTSEGMLAFSHYARLDLTVSIPATVPVELEDSSGDLELKNVQSAKVADGSGDADIADIHGNLQVTDSSGDLKIRTVSGNVSVTDSSGDLEIKDVQGDIDIPIDSSGDIRITQARSVHIHNDSSGDIVIHRVSNDVRVDSDSSGDINVDDIGGNFSVGADSSGSIHHDKVSGTVQLPQK